MANSQSAGVRKKVVAAARELLSTSPAYAYYFSDVEMEFDDGILTIRGPLPSFYAKQLLQTRLRNVDGVKSINNQTDVLNFVSPGRK